MVTNIEKEKFPSQPLPNPKGVHEVGTKSEIHHEKVKSVTILRSGRLIDNMVGTLEKKVSSSASMSKQSKEISSNSKEVTKDSFSQHHDEPSVAPYIPKAPFPQRLGKVNQVITSGEIMESLNK